jgi:hypothetical protein
MKLKILLSIFMPFGWSVVSILRNKDANSTGLDDIVANQIEAALKSLQQYVDDGDTNPLPI